MESGTSKLLESTAHRILHAHNFSRSSSQASLVLTDLLSRYLTLLTSTCAKYTQHAGRARLTVWDAIEALDELGISVDELSEFSSFEGKELSRYAIQTSRRVEDLNELKAQLADGLRLYHDAIPLYFARYTAPLPDNSGDEEERDTERGMEGILVEGHSEDEREDVDMPPPRIRTNLSRKGEPPRLPTLPLPLSPISNPSSPLRKRQRTSTWQPPAHVPDFLPPFPTISKTQPSPVLSQLPHPILIEPPTTQVENIKIEKPPLSLSQPLTSSSASDYLVQVPYSQSSLSGVAEWHLPSPPPPPSLLTRPTRLPTPQTEPALIAAYHHILTHPPPPNTNPPTPSRHKVAMALLALTQTMSRWDSADTLYSSVAPCPPRIPAIAPTYPLQIVDPQGADSKSKNDSKEKDIKFPPTIPRPVSTIERLTPLLSQQSSRIPDLARHVLPPTIHARTSRLTHPPALHRGNKPLVYGTGVPAPWNANVLSTGDAVPPTPMTSKTKDGPNELSNSKDKGLTAKPLIPDARLFATWDYESKDFRVPLAPSRNRGRVGSVQGGSGVISLALGSRGKNGSKVV